MQSLHQASEAAEAYSPAEEQFNRRRQVAGLVLGPAVFFTLLFVPLAGLSGAAQSMAAIFGLVVVLWVTEALPIAVTALLAPVLAVALQVAPARQVFAPFADPIIFLFIGSFMLAQAMFVHGVDRRIAYTALSVKAVGNSAFRIMFVYVGVCTFISMWISNTATTAMMFPIGLSLIAHLTRSADVAQQGRIRAFALSMMLFTSFGPSIGGIATPVGTPPNLIGMGLLEKIAGVKISFFSWMALGLPITLLLFAFMMVQAYFGSARHVPIQAGSTDLVRDEMRKLGPWSAGERNVVLAFGLTIVLWLIPGVFAVLGMADSALARSFAAAMPESVAAMTGALLLFVMPVNWRRRTFTLDWSDAVRIDWGIVLLYGGGLALGELVFSTGLAKAMGEGITGFLPAQNTVSLTLLFTAAAIIMSEAASNTASANMIVPIAIAVAQAAGVRVIEPALGATLGASMGFMMPISTPPNAIVYSSGFIPIREMMRRGVWLDIAGFVIIVSLVLTLGPLLF